KLDKDSLGYAFPVELRPLPFKDGGVIALKNKMNIDYADYINERGILLENITIESRQKTSMEKLNQEYSSGFFSGNIYSRNLDLREERYVGDIFEYLRERLPGLKISGEPGNYILNYRGGNLSYYLGLESPESSGNVSIFLNDMPVSPIILETILLSEIALVKLFPTSSAVPGGGSALVVYTKKGADAELPAFSRTD